MEQLRLPIEGLNSIIGQLPLSIDGLPRILPEPFYDPNSQQQSPQEPPRDLPNQLYLFQPNKSYDPQLPLFE